jgi:acyl-coenzyme A thioesterase PaaI-like protein
MRAIGRVVHRSRNLFLAEAELHDGRQRQVARGSGSFMRSAIALSADLGYV